MAVRHGYGKIAGTDALVFAYDIGDTVNSFKGEPTTNYVPGTYGYSLYAYASGPVDTVVLNEKNKSITAKRYTITQAVNTARAAIYPSTTTGVPYTFSFKWRYNGTTTTTPSITVSAAKGYPETNTNSFTSQVSDTVVIGNGWYLTTYTFVFSSNPNSACILTFGISTGSTAGYVGETFDIYEAQFEIKNHRTQYANGTRSATQGLVDLTGNSTINLANVSFDSNAKVVWDGTNDFISLENLTWGTGLTGVTLEFVVKSQANNKNLIKSDGNGILLHYNGAGFYLNSPDNNTSGYLGWNGKLSGGTGVYEHLIATWDGTTMKLYVNGVSTGTTLAYTAGISGVLRNLTGVRIGDRFNDTQPWFNGDVLVTKVYNRALTAAEVLNNYNQYKGRFNL